MIPTINTGVFVKGQRTTQGEIHNQYIRCGACDGIVKRLGKQPLSEDIQREIKPFLEVNGICKSCLDRVLNPVESAAKKAAPIEEPWRTSVTSVESRTKSVA